MTNPLINAYKVAQNLGVGTQGMDAREGAPVPQSFQNIFDGLSHESSQNNSVSSVSQNMFTSTRDLMRDAENKAKLSAEEKIDPLEVSHAMNNASIAAEQLTTTISKTIEAYKSVANMQF
ncbi:hypothetical protein Bealeia1_00118 [Candidatus Bealeia paramacronuclearis]|uniref:Flagellar hook-basal body complex protein FliE n=1 Tax=Candidatus Bealeia paramacronuclearis TaxID=1921001 RepID=A0ABZ2C0G5_9PROT|nr:hypothetical protein [Candidatus Bealeia paramacronuclearis]